MGSGRRSRSQCLTVGRAAVSLAGRRPVRRSRGKSAMLDCGRRKLNTSSAHSTAADGEGSAPYTAAVRGSARMVSVERQLPLVGLILLACGQPAPGGDYVDPAGFSFTYPDGWVP